MNKLKIDSNHSVQVSTKNPAGIYATIIKNDSELFGGYFDNGTLDSVIKKWAEEKIVELKNTNKQIILK